VGCDIHVHVEIKIKGEWHHYNHPDVDRNYQLFGRMAGVRGTDEPIAELRGLPQDVTKATAFDRQVHWGSDAHSVSWLTAEEVGQLEEEMKTVGYREADFGYLFGNHFYCLKKYPEEFDRHRDEGFDDARIVFWFDN